MKKTFFAVYGLFASLSLAAQNPARVDISGVPSVKLNYAEQSGVRISHGHWQKPEHVEKYLTISYPPSNGWTEGKVTFTPETDGRLRIVLLGPRINGGKTTRLKPAGVYYDNIRVNGKLIPNGDFEAGRKGFSFPAREKRYPGRIISNPAIAKSGDHCVLAWHDGEAAFGIPVRAKEPVTLSFDYRDAGMVPPDSETNHFHPLSLSAAANMGFADETPGDGKGGWTDQGPKNDLRLFQPGLKSFHGWPFRVLDPKENHARSCVIFQSPNAVYGRERVTLPVGRKCNAVALLNACAWAKTGAVAATVEVAFANGMKERFPLVIGRQTGDWWNPKSLPEAEVVWKAGGDNGEIGLYLTLLKLKHPGTVRSITITPGRDGAVFALAAATAGWVVKSNDDITGMAWRVPLEKRAALTVLPVEILKLEMAKKKFPAERFFDEKKSWKRLEVLNGSGGKLEHGIVKFNRNFSPLIFVRTKGDTDSLQLKIGTEEHGRVLSPRQAFRLFTGKEHADYRSDGWGAGRFVYPEDAVLRQTRTVADEDSFYNSAEAMNADSPEWIHTFELKEPKAWKMYIYSRSPENFTNNVFASVDNGETVKIGGNFNQPSFYYWSGGERVFLKPGKHTIRIFTRGGKERRKNLSLAKLYLAEDLRPPVQPGIADELAALKKNGFFVYGAKETVLAEGNSGDRLRRIVSEERSFPDLSSLTAKTRIDQRGALSPSGTEFRFADGTAVPQIWGCNMGTGALYDLALENRIGGDALDQYLKRIKSMGYSAIRYMISTLPREWGMNQNNQWPPLLSRNPLKFAPEFLANLQKLVAACHRNGLYLFITLWHDNCFFSDLGGGRSNHAYIGFFHPEAIRRQKEIVRMFMATPNPYRGGLPPAKDPTVLIYEIENERTYVATFLLSNPSDWRKLPPATREFLYARWADYLKKKYSTVEKLKKTWNLSSLSSRLRSGRSGETFENVDFPPTWNKKEWGGDPSDLKVKLDDLRISEASFGREKRSNPVISDGLEFMYAVYRDYLKEMYSYARSLGFKGVITANGPDCELYYSQRAGAGEVLDAVSGGTGYWNRSGYGFLRSLSWLAPMVYASAPGKPMISREYGANLVYENCWWGNLITATVQKAMGKAYLFNFSLGVPDLKSPDWFYPDDSFEKRERINLNQDAHLYGHFANLASAIAVRSPELKKPEFKLEIAFPLDNICYAAPFRGYNRMTLNNFVPFLYTDSSVRTFDRIYNGRADLVVNEPSVPSGDYSRAGNFFAVRPHSSLNRYGQPEEAWFRGKRFRAEGFMAKEPEQKAFYDALQTGGARLPVSFAEFGKVWRDAGKYLELDTRSATYRADTPTFASFIGGLENGKEKMPHPFRLSGEGDAWSFFGRLPDDSTLFFAVMNGKIDLKETGKLRYLFLGGRRIEVERNGKPFLSLLGGNTVNIAVKSDEPLIGTPSVYVTFFRSKSSETPAELTFARKIRSVEACDREGNVLAGVPFSGGTFRNLWENGNRISCYKVSF